MIENIDELRVGNVVRLKSDSTEIANKFPMTINDIVAMPVGNSKLGQRTEIKKISSYLATCVWRDSNGVPQIYRYDLNCLEKL